MIIDTHAHLDFPDYESDLILTLQNAKHAGVERVINVGIDLPSSRKSIELSEEINKKSGLPKIFAGVGIHPNHASENADDVFGEIESLANHENVVAIGETGLDYYRDYSSPDDQKRLFRKHIELALKLDLPVIIHNREATDDCLDILAEYAGRNLKGVIHCYSSDKDHAKKFLKLGMYISFTGTVTYPNAKKLREALKCVPTDRLLLETDCPFLAPQSKRGKRNEPSYLKYVIPLMAETYDLSENDIEHVTSNNARLLFGLGLETPKAEIAYVIRNSLYLNITNKCPNDCIFCERKTFPYVKGHYLKLENEPSIDELIAAIGDPSGYDEVVFCGFGEPTERLDVVKSVAKYLKDKGVRVRLDTNGLGNLVNGRSISAELKGLIDHICVSLNSNLQEQYDALCKPAFGDRSYPELLKFIKEAKDAIPNTLVSVVDMPDVDVEACRKIADDCGVSFRLRKYNDTGFKNDSQHLAL